MEASSINANNDPGVWQQEILLFEGLHVFVSMIYSVSYIEKLDMAGLYLEFAIL